MSLSIVLGSLGGSPPISPVITAERGFSRRPAVAVSLIVAGDLTGSQTFLFSYKESPPLTLQFGQDVRPYILGDIRGRPVKIDPDKGLTQRGRMTITFADDPDAPDFDGAVFSINSGLSFWRRLVLAQPDLVGSVVEIRRGFVGDGLLFSDFPTIFKGRVEDFDFQENATFSLVVKDIFNFVDQQVPKQISDNNQLNGAILIDDPTITIDKGLEFTDPNNLSSPDFFPIVLQIDPEGVSPEQVIIGSISGNVLTVQDNFLDKSEDFTNAIWAKNVSVTVTADQSVGPLGGDVAAELLAFAVVGDRIEQNSGTPANDRTFTFSVWLRATAAVTVPDAFSIDLLLSDGSQFATASLVITRDWRRYEVTKAFGSGSAQNVIARIRRGVGDAAQIFAFGAQLEIASARGSYVATDGNNGADAGRGAFGTTAAGFADDTEIAEVLPYRLHLSNSGVHPVVILRDLVNRGGIAVSDVDQATFDREFAFEESVQLRRSGDTLITRPRKLSEHMTEVRQQSLLDLWVSEPGLVNTRFSFRQNLPGVQTKTITDGANIIARSASYKGNKETRKNEVYVYFNPVVGETDPSEPEDFQNVQVVADLVTSVASGPKAETILSKWIFRSAEAISTAGRLVSRFKRGARLASWGMDLKDTADFDLGDIIQLDSEDVPVRSGPSAVRGKTFWQTVQKFHKRIQGWIDVQGLEFSGLNYGIISPNEDLETPPDAFPDFPDASAAERQFGFIGDANNLVNAGTEQGYFIL